MCLGNGICPYHFLGIVNSYVIGRFAFFQKGLAGWWPKAQATHPGVMANSDL